MKQLLKTIKAIIRMYLQILIRLDLIIYYLFFRLTGKMQPDSILMLSDSRETLSGNLQFIDAELKKQGKTPKYFLKKNLAEKKSLKEKLQLCKMMAEAEYILVDDFYPLIYPIPLNKKTKLIQVWHAMGAFKTVGFSRMGKPGGPSPYSLTHRNYTDAIVSSEAIRKNYAEAFRMPVAKVHATGVPRTDIFFDPDYEKQVKDRIYSKYPQLKGKKVIIFAPTFRGNGQKTAHYDYKWFDFEAFRKAFTPDVKKSTGEDADSQYICIIKMHPFIKNKPENLSPDFYLDLTEEREINDLLFISDILITDYSSVIFEASLRSIKTIFYVPDLEEYIASRDFYYPFTDYTWGPVARNMSELIEAVSDPSIDSDRLNTFKNLFCSACDGHSTKRFVEEMMKW